ncbi:MAG TPA: hypothetical protein ENJ30_10630 [Desulfobulbaceae bacterium]|nr:hypothetical protein [Desulfobulbaceae bacterium]
MSNTRDIQRSRQKKVGLIGKIVRLLVDSGNQAVLLHRFAHFFFQAGIPLLPALIRRTNVFLTGADIFPSCRMGKGVTIIHSVGVVIGNNTVIGDNCELYGQATLGGRGGIRDDDGTPVIEDNCVICVGAKVLGRITVGKNTTIAAGAVVLTSIPEHSLAAGLPATVKKNYLSIKED